MFQQWFEFPRWWPQCVAVMPNGKSVIVGYVLERTHRDYVSNVYFGIVRNEGGSLPTPTATFTRTYSPTFSNTPTATATRTRTPTRTSTPTRTETRTFTATTLMTPISTPSRTPTRRPCTGDCDGNRAVSIDELVRMVDISMKRGDLNGCQMADVNQDGVVTIDEVVLAVGYALYGCR